MNLDQLTSDLRDAIQHYLPNEWASTAITVVLILLITAAVSAVLTTLIRRLLDNDNSLLPSSSIFVNLTRVAVWIISICIILSSCFNVDVSALITALGVGGIAVSLGFQSTLSNVISGLLISFSKLVEPGDYISVNSNEGLVHDVTWRHTSIITPEGEWILVPNSVINSNALTKLYPQNDIRIDIIIRPNGKSIDHRIKQITQAVDTAISKIAILKRPASVVLHASKKGKDQDPETQDLQLSKADGSTEDKSDLGTSGDTTAFPAKVHSADSMEYVGLLCFSVGKGVRVRDVEGVALEVIKPNAWRIGSDEKAESEAAIWAFHSQKAEIKMRVNRRRRQERLKKRKKENQRKHKSLLRREELKRREHQRQTEKKHQKQGVFASEGKAVSAKIGQGFAHNTTNGNTATGVVGANTKRKS